MPNMHVEVRQTVRAADPPRDYAVNNLYFSGGQSTTPAFQDLTDRVMAAFNNAGSGVTWGPWSQRGFQVKCYNLADPTPRPVMATSVFTPGAFSSAQLLPRQLAVCLSFYADRNLPRRRGRIYLGPWDSVGMANERLSATIMSQCLDLGKKLYAIAGLGTFAWLHSIHSSVGNLTTPTAHYFVNDLVDTQRRRANKETARQRYDP